MVEELIPIARFFLPEKHHHTTNDHKERYREFGLGQIRFESA